ncbi:hypothetical protein [Spirulina major]|uniref:hypothetical protein n=1 Tax=Spirulina major TaxID=270636 RepID=UPI000933D3BE|nr:hypothetical protein [Spirulina major]
MSGRIADCVIQSNDLVASEDLKVNGLVCGRHRAESIVRRVCILRFGLTTVGLPWGTGEVIRLGRLDLWWGWSSPARFSPVDEPRIPVAVFAGSVKQLSSAWFQD